MTVTRGAALFLSVALAGTLAKAAAPAGPAAGPRLTAISSRVHNKGASLVIEATSPVPYVTTRPDPLTVFVDFRNVGAEGLANSVARNAKSPIAGVVVEAADALGAPTSRVRITLSRRLDRPKNPGHESTKSRRTKPNLLRGFVVALRQAFSDCPQQIS